MSISKFHVVDWERVRELNILNKFLVSFVVVVLKRTTFVLNQTSETMHVANCCGSCNFGTISMSTNSRHSDLVVVHETNNIFTHIL